MSDQLENWIQQNRESFDTIEPKSELWDKIQADLPDPPTPPSGGGEPGPGPGGGGFASSGLVKWALGLATAAVVGTAAFFALQGDEPVDKPDTVFEPGTESLASATIQPPMPNFNVPYTHYEVDPATGGEFSYPSGTVIGVPEGAFVDADGKPVSGPVDLRYREFHDAVQIMASGIPMVHTDENGVAHDFQTAGMNEVRAFQNGEEVFLAPNKKLQVKMASYTDEDDHKLWRLNEETGNWEDEGMAELQPNPEVAAALAALPEVPKAPVPPAKAEESNNILEFDVDYSQFPHLRPYKKILWEYVDEDQVENNMWIFGEAWNETKLSEQAEGESTFTLTLKNKRKEFALEVRPVLEGADYDAALAKYNSAKAEHDRLKEVVRKEKEALAGQAGFFRIFDIPRTGVMNCDRYLVQPNIARLEAVIEFDEGVQMDRDLMQVFLLTGESRACLSFDKLRLKNFVWGSRQKNALVTVVPGPKFAVFTAEDFKDLKYKQIAKDHDSYTFHLRTLEQSIEDPEDLREAIGM